MFGQKFANRCGTSQFDTLLADRHFSPLYESLRNLHHKIFVIFILWEK